MARKVDKPDKPERETQPHQPADDESGARQPRASNRGEQLLRNLLETSGTRHHVLDEFAARPRLRKRRRPAPPRPD